jgi:hypothetical protein
MPPQLTFGVELEFLLATLPDGKRDPNPSDPRDAAEITKARSATLKRQRLNLPPGVRRNLVARQAVKDVTEAHGFPVQIAVEVRNEDYDATNFWRVDTDGSINEKGTDADLYIWEPIEVISPAFLYTPLAVREVRRMCGVLTSNLRINVNETCGLHVHVGSGKDGLSLDVMKRFLIFMLAFEPLFEFIHPAHRVNNHSYARSLRAAVEEKSDTITFCEVAKLWMDPEMTIKDLIEWVGNTKYAAYNILNLTVTWGSQTLEFRQHEMTLDGARVAVWIDTVVGLMNVMHSADPMILTKLCMDRLIREDADLVGEWDTYSEDEPRYLDELLAKIGLKRPSEFYESSIDAKVKKIEQEFKKKEDKLKRKRKRNKKRQRQEEEEDTGLEKPGE